MDKLTWYDNDGRIMCRRGYEVALARLASYEATGLTPEQVEKSRNTYGSNSFGCQSRESLAKKIWDASTEPMLLMLIFAAIITLAVNITRYFTGGEYNFLECVGIFAMSRL